MGGDGDFNILAYTDADLELGGEKDIFDEHLGIKVRRLIEKTLMPPPALLRANLHIIVSDFRYFLLFEGLYFISFTLGKSINI